RPRGGVRALVSRRRAHARDGRDPRLPLDRPRARRRLDDRTEALAARARRRGDDDAARRARHPRRVARDRRARLRAGGGSAWRIAHEDPLRRDPAEHHEPADGGGEPPPHVLDRAHRRPQLPRIRPAAAQGRLGTDDQREPAGTDDPALGCGDAGDRDRPADRGHEPDRRRSRTRGDRTRARRRRAVILEVDSLRIELEGSGIDIVDDVSFHIDPGEVLGLVGESGSGKTTVGLALLGHTRRGATIAGGEVRVDGKNILAHSARELRALRGRTVSYVPQDPSSALNPALRIGLQLEETLAAHRFGANEAARQERLSEMLDEVLLPSDRAFLRRYPHQLSGGQQQRIGLAMAFACRPRVIVLDEPTTGLDVTTQSHILETVRELCKLHGVAALYVSHDLAVVAVLADRVAVMYAGRMVEVGPQAPLFRAAAQ